MLLLQFGLLAIPLFVLMAVDVKPFRWQIGRGFATSAAIVFTVLAGLGLSAGAVRDAPVLLVLYAVCAVLACVVVRSISDPPKRILMWAGFRWAVLIGVPTFFAGYVGALVFLPESNMAPLLGFFLTGPLGALVGATAGVVGALATYRAERAQYDHSSA